MNEDELRERKVPEIIFERLRRLRGLYAYWLQFPTKGVKDVVEFEMKMFGIAKTVAYEDIHITQLLIGNLQRASKDFMRWKINCDLDEDLKAARRAQDWRAVAAIQKNRILNNRTDKEDEPELEFDKIVPQTFVPVDDPSVIGIERVPDLRGKIRRMIEKYSRESDYTDYEEIEDGGAE